MPGSKPTRYVNYPLFLLAIFALSLIVFVSPANGQASKTTGTIEGRVTDQTGAAVVGITITVTQELIGFEKSVTSDDDGNYHIISLPPGIYTLRIEETYGFASVTREKLELSSGQTLNLQIALQLAGTSGNTTVTITETKTQTSTTITDSMIDRLPITGTYGRNPLPLLGLQPGVTMQPATGAVSVNGSRDRAFNFTLDGIDINSGPTGNLRGGASLLSLESVSELQVITNGASAEYGRSSGSFVNLITKSGDNDFHGTAFLYFRDKVLASEHQDDVAAMIQAQDSRRYQFGGNFGGPIKHERAFFFAAYERVNDDSSRFNRIAPPLAQIFARHFNSPDEEGLIERTYHSDSLNTRGDFTIKKRNNLTVRYSTGLGKQTNGIFTVPTWGRSANGRDENGSNVLYANLRTTLNPNMANELRAQYTRESGSTRYAGPDLPDVLIGSTDSQTGVLTSYRFGRPYFLPSSSLDNRINFIENFSIQRGDHAVKAGFEFSRARVKEIRPAFARGRYIFASIEAFQDYLDDPGNFDGLLYYSQFVPIGGRTAEQAATQEFSNSEPGFFIQDRWRLSSNVTMDYGLRYEAQVQAQPSMPLSERRYAQFIGQPGFPSDGSIPSETKGWQPRFGIAWDPFRDGKTSIRANFGIYYARVPGSIIASVRNADGATASYISTCCGHGFLPPPPANLGIFTDAAELNRLNPSVRVFAADFRAPRTLQWGAFIEREIGRGIIVNSGFIYTNTVHLNRFVNRNGPTFTGNFAADGRRLFDGPQPFARPDGSGIGELATAESSARSLYRAFTFEVKKRFSKKYYFFANYVLSWNYSDDDEGSPYAFRYADVLDFQPEYSYSDRDQRYRFNAAAMYELPYDFQVSVAVQARAAQPDSPFLLSDVNEDGNAFDRAFVGGRDVGRNTVRKKNRRSSVDVRVTRIVKRGEKKRVELFAEIFNMFNSANLSPLPNSLLFNFDTRIRAGTGDPRQLQLGVRFSF